MSMLLCFTLAVLAAIFRGSPPMSNATFREADGWGGSAASTASVTHSSIDILSPPLG